MKEHLQAVAEKVLNIATDQGVDAEAFLLHNRELSIEVNNAQVETLKQAEEIGLGIRIIKNGCLGFTYTSDLADNAIITAVKNAINIAQFTTPDEHNSLPKKQENYPELGFLYDDEFNTINIDEKINLAKRVEEIAQNYDNRIKIVESATYEDTEFSSLIVNTNGLYACEKANYGGIYVFLVAEEQGIAENGYAMMVNRKLYDINPELVAKEATQNALRSLNAKRIDSAQLPSIMEPYIMTKFMGLIAQMINANAVQKGKSLFANKEGEIVASPIFNLVDDGLLQDGIASFPFDSEGVGSRKNDIITKGILQGFLYDTYTANKAGINSTGNAARGSFRGLPTVGTTNFTILPGDKTPKSLISDIEKGFYITEVMGMHTANPVSGDFSVGAAGIMIEQGELTYPVRGVTIAGNLIDFLQDIDAIGNDIRFFGGRSSPTIRLKSLSIGGE
ncbi:MAG: TldD/PmbA family protein [Syntrophomonadaceae bacterium]|nr:TldD/PmbA family protein [Syntrophomonadaceae bacterium]